MRLPCGNNGLNAGLELDDTNLRLFVQISRLDVEQIGPPSQAICLAFIVKCVEYLHYRCQTPMLASRFVCLQTVSLHLRLMGRTDIPSWDSIPPV